MNWAVLRSLSLVFIIVLPNCFTTGTAYLIGTENCITIKGFAISGVGKMQSKLSTKQGGSHLTPDKYHKNHQNMLTWAMNPPQKTKSTFHLSEKGNKNQFCRKLK